MSIQLALEGPDHRAGARPVRAVELDLDGHVRRLSADEARALAEELSIAARLIEQLR
jgi:hypothetical protein